jgi:gamma-glutamyltranspeptidase
MPLPQQRLLMRVMVQSITVMTWVLLNNEMDDFSAKAGVPNMFGLVGNEANSIAQDAEFHDITIVEKNGLL